MASNWHETSSGVMLWKPAFQDPIAFRERSFSRMPVGEEHIQDAFYSSYGQYDEQDTVLPSVENLHGFAIKIESGHDQSSGTSRSSGTLSTDLGEIVFTQKSTDHLSSPPPAEDAFLKQLQAYASGSNEEFQEPVRKRASTPLSEIPMLETDTDYDSDRTNFQPNGHIPCPIRGSRTLSHQKSRTNQALRKIRSAKRAPSVRRKLDFRSVKQADVLRKRPRQNLIRVGRLEYSRPHRWKETEREFLCVLWRYYSRDPITFATIFNTTFGLDLSMSKVRGQYENHIRLMGENAFQMYKDVQSVPFEDPEGIHDELRHNIEAIAQDLDLDISRLEEEAPYPSGRGAKANSRRTRKCYKALVRKAKEKKKLKSVEMPVTETRSTQRLPLGGVPLVTNSVWNDSEYFTDTEDVRYTRHKSSANIPGLPSELPHLVFRVWDDSSRSKFVKGAFVAQGFLDEDGQPPAPLPPNDIYRIWRYLAALHLSKEGDTPLFISTTASILQCLSYSLDMESPRLAVIDLQAPCLLEVEHKLQNARCCFQWLKPQGLTRWAKYKGHGEYFSFANIPKEAILHTFDLADLWHLAAKDCSPLIRPENFRTGLRTTAVASAMRDSGCPLSPAIAGAMGRLAKLFGMTKPYITERHLRDLVARMVDGFAVEKHPATDMSVVARSFVSSLGPHVRHSNQAIQCAFVDGVEDGLDCIAHWSRSRSGGKHANRRVDRRLD